MGHPHLRVLGRNLEHQRALATSALQVAEDVGGRRHGGGICGIESRTCRSEASATSIEHRGGIGSILRRYRAAAQWQGGVGLAARPAYARLPSAPGKHMISARFGARLAMTGADREHQFTSRVAGGVERRKGPACTALQHCWACTGHALPTNALHLRCPQGRPPPLPSGAPL